MPACVPSESVVAMCVDAPLRSSFLWIQALLLDRCLLVRSLDLCQLRCPRVPVCIHVSRGFKICFPLGAHWCPPVRFRLHSVSFGFELCYRCPAVRFRSPCRQGCLPVPVCIQLFLIQVLLPCRCTFGVRAGKGIHRGRRFGFQALPAAVTAGARLRSNFLWVQASFPCRCLPVHFRCLCHQRCSTVPVLPCASDCFLCLGSMLA